MTQIVWILFLIEIVLPVIHLVTERIVWVSRPRRFFTQIHMYARISSSSYWDATSPDWDAKALVAIRFMRPRL